MRRLQTKRLLLWMAVGMLVAILAACKSTDSRPMPQSKRASIGLREAITIYQLAKNRPVLSLKHKKFMDIVGKMIQDRHLVYIERKEYWGEVPDLHNLEGLKLEESCLSQNIIMDLMERIPEEEWGSLSPKEIHYVRYALPYYQRINRCLLAYKTQIVRIAIDSDNDYIIAIPTKDAPSSKAWRKAIKAKQLKLIYYPPLGDKEIIAQIRKNLHIVK